jgi:hypothetical protein
VQVTHWLNAADEERSRMEEGGRWNRMKSETENALLVAVTSAFKRRC